MRSISIWIGFASGVLLLSLANSIVAEKQLNVADRHILRHKHVIRCRYCFCGHGALGRARHHCPGDRELLECIDVARVCYRCSCGLREVETPEIELEEEDDDEDNHDSSMNNESNSKMNISPLASSSPSVSASMSVSSTPSVSMSVSASASALVEAQCRAIVRNGEGGVTSFGVEVGASFGRLVMRYTTDEVFDSFSVSYNGDLSYTLPSSTSGIVIVEFSGSSNMLRVRLVAKADTRWEITIECAE